MLRLVGAVLGVAGWALGTADRVRVEGASMVPALLPGDRLLVLGRHGPWRGPRPGDLVTVADPREPQRVLVKRFVGREGRTADVRGDNPAASTDSRNFGRVGVGELTGRAVYRYAPASRTGRLP